ncbi:MAG: hypothetical protein ACRDCE_18855, partial [Cetobacterium sp.]|uniref:hypothetical protein n=1 Tax=Cetobacterium sp. TaxID=2071632 RepID=UPI003EE78591
DVITRHDQAWVLEVNTAPGLQGSNLDSYVNNLTKVFLNQPLDAWIAPVRLEEEDDNPSPNTPTVRSEAAEARPVAPTAEPERPRVSPSPIRANESNAGNSQPAPAQRGDATPRTNVSVRHNSFYRATVNGEPTIVQYNVEVDGFYMPGWEIPMNQGDQGFTVHLDQEIVL